MSHRFQHQKFRRKKTFNVKVYYCDNCGHIFHTLKKNLEMDLCSKCYKGFLSIIDEYKSKRPPRVSGRKGTWLTKWGIYQPYEALESTAIIRNGGK